MPSICFYFQVHQPFRIRRYSYFDVRRSHDYFDDHKNSEIMRKVANKCYLPTNQIIFDLIKKFDGKFKVAYSITGTAIEQMKRYAPEVLESFVSLANTGCVEFIGETSYHSLSSVYNLDEFDKQVAIHRSLMKECFDQEPRILRNTELIYADFIGQHAAKAGYLAMIAEGADDILQWKSPHFVYTVPNADIKLLLKSYKLSDDIAFRFSNREWKDYPLTSEKFASWIHQISGSGEVVNLFMDYETFGEHQWEASGIFEFLKALPAAILNKSDWSFKTPTEVIQGYKSVGELNFPRLTSWADVDRDLTAWQGNKMQNSALRQIFAIADDVYAKGDPHILDVWRKLQTSDNYYYMCTKWFADGDVHAYFSPYESPYEGFVNFMNVLKDFREYYLGHKLGPVEGLPVG